jgi:hypothetical protein
MSATNTVSPLHQRMIKDMAARKLNPHTQRSHIHSCKRFVAWLKRSPDTATRRRSPTGRRRLGRARALVTWQMTRRERGLSPLYYRNTRPTAAATIKTAAAPIARRGEKE